MNFRVFDSPESLSEAAASHVIAKVESGRSPFHMVLSGGSTPKRLYSILGSLAYADSKLWDKVHLWWGDERFVPPSDSDSNERMVLESLLSRIAMPSDNVHPMYRAGSAEDAATAYEEELRSIVGDHPFGLVLLGLGPDAHTASLFPGDPSVHESERWVLASEGAAGVKQRLTLTPPRLRNSEEILFLVAGPDKAEPLSNVFAETYDPDRYPAQVVACNSTNVQWFLDTAAAAKL